jgi:hypothetical protein
MRIWQRLVQGIGVVSFALSVWGFYWLVYVFRRELVRPLHMAEAPFFRRAFFTMNAIDTVFLVAMMLTSVGLLLLKPSAMKVYTWLWVTLVVYEFAVGMLWNIRGPIGTSIGAASGVGDIGLGPLVFYPFPFVYPILSVGLVNLAARQLRLTTARLGDRGLSISKAGRLT